MSITPGPWTERAKKIDGVVSDNYREITGGALVESQADDPSLWGYDCLRMLAVARAAAAYFAETDSPLGIAARAAIRQSNHKGNTMTPTDFTNDELLDIGNALEAAAKATATELGLASAKPYTRALEAQQRRYELLFARVVRAVEGSK